MWTKRISKWMKRSWSKRKRSIKRKSRRCGTERKALRREPKAKLMGS